MQNPDLCEAWRSQVADPNSPAEKTEERDEVTFEGPVDSVYLGASKDYVELDVGTGAAVAISSSGWEDVVVVGAAARAPSQKLHFRPSLHVYRLPLQPSQKVYHGGCSACSWVLTPNGSRA